MKSVEFRADLPTTSAVYRTRLDSAMGLTQEDLGFYAWFDAKIQRWGTMQLTPEKAELFKLSAHDPETVQNKVWRPL